MPLWHPGFLIQNFNTTTTTSPSFTNVVVVNGSTAVWWTTPGWVPEPITYTTSTAWPLQQVNITMLQPPTRTPHAPPETVSERVVILPPAEHRAATERARELLLSLLDEEQKASFQKSNRFIVTGRSGRRYRIRRGMVGNVDVLAPDNDNRIEHCLCFHPVDATLLPLEDVMLAQMLHLANDEDGTRRIANIHGRSMFQ